MNSADLLQLQHYDLGRALEFVAVWILMVFLAVLLFGLRAQYRLMTRYDELYQQNSDPTSRARAALSHVKAVIFGILGYQGQRREREPLDQLNEGWIVSNLGKIAFRFAVFYFVYIWALILTTRAVIIDPQSGDVQLLHYTSKQLFGFLMIAVYIISNSAFDILSLYVTVRHLRKIQENPRAATAALYLGKNLLYCFIFFLLSQVVSNLIWPLKTGLSIPWFDRPFSLAIALWPYAFVIDANSTPPEYVNLFFPGQLLITGTVFLPTLVAVLLIVVTAAMVAMVQPLKRIIISEDWTLLGITVRAEPGQKPVYQFRCINVFTMGIVSGVFAIALWEWVKAFA